MQPQRERIQESRKKKNSNHNACCLHMLCWKPRRRENMNHLRRFFYDSHSIISYNIDAVYQTCCTTKKGKTLVMLQFAVHGRAISTLFATRVSTRCELHDLFKLITVNCWFGNSSLEDFVEGFTIKWLMLWTKSALQVSPHQFDLNRLQRSPSVPEVDVRRQQVKDDQDLLFDFWPVETSVCASHSW